MDGILELLQLTYTDLMMIGCGVIFFLIYWKISAVVLFEPLLELFEERERLTSGVKDKATGLLEEAEKLNTIYNEAINAARAEAVSKRLADVAEAAKGGSAVVAAAENKARSTVAEGRGEFEKLEERLRSDLSGDVQSLSQQLADQILSGKTSGAATAIALLFGGGILLSPEFAMAASDPNHVPSIVDTFVFWPHFLLFLFCMIFGLRKPFKSFWEKRVETIAEEVSAGERARIDAEEVLSAAEAQYSRTDEEVKAIAVRIAAEAENEVRRVRDEAREKAERIKERAQQTIDAERNSVETKVRDEIAEQIIQGARAILEGELKPGAGSTTEKDKALRGSVLENVGSILH